MPLALVSVHDKQGLAEFAHRLAKHGWRFLASGGTAETLRRAGLAPVDVAAYTKSPELLGGRVKTLHPAIHAGILARPHQSDLAQLKAQGWEPIDMVIVNLYPFEATVARPGATDSEIIEEIDIGGVALIRAAAKNAERVTLVISPDQYDEVAQAIETGGIPESLRLRLALEGFRRTASYDRAISAWMEGRVSSAAVATQGAEINGKDNEANVPASSGSEPVLLVEAGIERMLRYGENPHQQALFAIPTFMKVQGEVPAGFLNAAASSTAHSHSMTMVQAGPLGGRVLGGKELSYNNLLDLDTAWRAVLAFQQPAAVIVKHLSPCGIAVAESPAAAFQAALACDPVSAFGGIVALNRTVDESTAEELRGLFLECVAAPTFSDAALNLLSARKNLRLVEGDPELYTKLPWELRSAAGGILVQTRDAGDPAGTEWRVASTRAPTAAEMEALRFAWHAVQHVKSNAIVLARGTATVGIGGGQTNRVDAVRQACARAGDRARGAVMASDAFFPFPDGIEAAAEAGVTAVVHPGGSVRDAEVLEAANRLGMAVVLTGIRHFRH
ncbi:MAG: bifunctional phosphoribosylaminoimidazolecarboxamide formyltransferase/IMP cyclohydrolase [Spirochaetaceae bacterium]|nr:bifunctional phosphoribosylaminoimidazolecarboxamide formyltransferase/IMP cyclohydrolase [Spirochaetaceae bacterium]